MSVNYFPGASPLTLVHLNYMRQMAEPTKLPEPTLEEIFTDVCLSLGVDHERMRKDGRSVREIAFAKKIFCYAAATMTSKKSELIADMVHLDRSLISTYKKDLQVYIKIKRPDFFCYWEQFIKNSKIWRDK